MKYLTWWESAGRIKINLCDSGSPTNRCIIEAELKYGCDGTNWIVTSTLNPAGRHVTIERCDAKEKAKEKMLAYVVARKFDENTIDLLQDVYFHELIPEVKAIGNKLTGGEICEQSATNW